MTALRLVKQKEADQKSGFEVAYSNQAFELWFLLHFKYHNGPLHRNRYTDLLEKYLGQLENEKRGIAPSEAESITTVHHLVKYLNKFTD